ncbi:hypothetical protein [Chryseobacterium geocarposphaerae]|uniref:YD repeat-containing protein n=1 Tax=Chryseobacterium geocarposphaerae TaxID=1416776 RepID=A0A2M9C8F7_9FLAO|nr:hypothetical protein [Chryseobacterium geocarposphaerae]PJJ67123.1 hypothetical protein CLV73_1120 [Chryseobacterium geocarposphaerae]
MKKNILIIILTCLAYAINAQTPTQEGKSYVGNINEMFPPAPTSNNLMKFEEVPVSYYTGVPDINIPLFNIPTSNKDVAVNIQLKYHPLNAKPDDRSGETGLGWSLIAGGTITRTVRGGSPDEKNRTISHSSPPKVKFGIYDHFQNPTYKIINDDFSFNFNDYTFYCGVGRFDTEYDLYQYNFMNYSGRFYITKTSAGAYVLEKLDKNNLQIVCGEIDMYGVIKSFIITDDKGVKYIFDAKERSQKNIVTVKIGMTTSEGQLIPTMDIADYFTSFHLVKINDQNNTNLVEFNYDLSSEVKFKETPTITYRSASNVYYTNYSLQQTGQLQSPDGSMPGSLENQTVYNNSQTKLLTSIDIKGKGQIYLNYEQGRQDSNYSEPVNLYKLKSIQSNYSGQPSTQYTEKYIFDYDYSNVEFQTLTGSEPLRKMLLKKVTKSILNGQSSEYWLDYNTNSSVLKKDDWGYYKSSAGLSLNNDIVTDVLKSITYPTKGKAIFNFEENEFSYNPTEQEVMTPVTGYNQMNDFEFSINFLQFNNLYKQQFFTIQSAQSVNLDLWLGNLIYFNWKLQLFKKNTDNTFSPVVYEFAYPAQTCNKPQPSNCFVLNPDPNGEIKSEFHPSVYLEPGTYYATLSGDFGPSNAAPTNETFVAHTAEPTYIDVKIYKGGGIRIKNISYYDDASANDFAKKYIYSYKNLDDAQRSSGALVFPKPIFKLLESYSYQNTISNPTIMYSADFNVTTDYNILPVQKTQGGDVGYKYVTVEQIDKNNNKKGRTEYKFRSPIDYPNEGTVVVTLPPIPIPNQDYLRGQVISEKKYDSNNNLVTETITDYTSSEYQKNDGVKIKDNFSNNMIAELFSFNSYQDMVNHGFMQPLTTPYKNFEKFGVTLPTQKVEKSYFYKNGISNMISTTTNNSYNPRDYLISVTKSFSDGESNNISYQYAHEKNDIRLITANMIGIPLVTEEKKNNKTISKIETFYNDMNHYFPSSLMSYDLQNPTTGTTEVTYDKYDDKGNLLQYTTRDGVVTSIIWGYNKTLPIAKIIGIDYTSISASFSDVDIVNASNTDAGAGINNDETSLLNTLAAFRNAYSRHQVTTYTYDPLVGVRSITPPSGIREVYIYDSANRLKEVREQNQTGKLLKEYQYHYKN